MGILGSSSARKTSQDTLKAHGTFPYTNENISGMAMRPVSAVSAEIVFPYDLITQTEIDQLGKKAKLEIFSRCKSHLQDADLVIALLDGSQVDDGTAWEIGYFYARKSPEQKIIGIRTDFRRAGESEGALVNPMIECSCDRIVRSKKELMETVSYLL
jgi:nucleoside 2-deoxyribosyltransferase